MLTKNTESKEDHIGIKDDDTLLIETCELIAPMTRIRGRFKLTTTSITFVPDQKQPNKHGSSRYIDLALNPPPLYASKSTSPKSNVYKKVEAKTLNSFTFTNSNSTLSQSQIEDIDDNNKKKKFNEYWIAVNVCSSYQQVGGTRYRLMNAHRFWLISELREIYFRRYELRNCAFELFFNDDSIWMFTFYDEETRNKIFNKIISFNPCNKKNTMKETTQKWIRREISNFQYLMRLNIFAGRTFNDLTQYPVVPWVIIDFESEVLDLKDVNIYRDLSKPIGALNKESLSKFMRRYESLKEDEEDCFMYGTHYSSMGNVLYYLLRIQPFTRYNLYFNDGKYDAADRLFHCIHDTFLGCLRNSSDVKELIPEFYYLPDFLQNKQHLDLGKRQNDGIQVSDVILPKWANNCAAKFIVTMREALESEHVSTHLHDWIDLIFGYKQRGIEAEKAFNVFHPYTYSGSVDIDSIEDEIEKRAILAQINEYGQTPMQLFNDKHPSRLLKKNQEILCTIFESENIRFYSCNQILADNTSIVAISQNMANNRQIIVIGSDYNINIYKWNQSKLCIQAINNPYSIFNIFNKTNNNKIGGDISLKIIDGSSCFAITENAHFAFCCGFANNSFIIWDVIRSTIVKCIDSHEGIVSCLAFDEEEEKSCAILVTGSYDKKVIVWRVKYNNTTIDINKKHSLVNQLSPILCVDISLKSGIIACCSVDGMVNVYNSSTGDHYCILQPFVDKYLIQMDQNKNKNQNILHSVVNSVLNIVRVSHVFGYILCYSKQTKDMFLYSSNGKIIACYSSNNDIYNDIKFSKCTNYIVCGGKNSMVRIKQIPSLKTKKKFKLIKKEIITRIYIQPKNQTTLFVGTASGNVFVYSLPQKAFLDVRIGSLDRHGF